MPCSALPDVVRVVLDTLRQQAAAECAVGEKLDALVLTELNHLHKGTAINQRKLHLVGYYFDTCLKDDFSVLYQS